MFCGLKLIDGSIPLGNSAYASFADQSLLKMSSISCWTVLFTALIDNINIIRGQHYSLFSQASSQRDIRFFWEQN